MPKVSVIIPAYNAMSYLPETLESVIKQTFTDFEVLIIDDGSTDNIRQWYINLVDKRIKLICQENQHLAAARNTGIDHSLGEYLAFLDADDIWEPTKLEKQVNCLESNFKIGLVHTWTVLIDYQGKPTGKALKSQAEGQVWQQIVQKNTIVVSSVMVRYSCLQNLGAFDRDLHYCEDYDLWIRLAAHYDFAVVKEFLTRYRLHPGSLSTHCQSVMESFRILIERAFKYVPTELLYLRNRGYGNQNLYLAWKSLNNRDYQRAIYYRQQAIAHYPQLQHTWHHLRLSFAIAIMQSFNPDIYQRLLAIFYIIRQRIFSNLA